jgi:predicted NAD/FAD-binding protein
VRIAIIGTGISGMYAAHRLYREHELTIYEASAHYGGHTATIDVELAGGTWAIDTGFIVFNDWTYPGFVALLDELGVGWHDSNMSFSLRCERTGLEYNGTSLNTLFAQRRNLLRPSFLRMLKEILRFNRESRALQVSADLTLGEFLDRCRYSEDFRSLYLIPMGRAIWSATEAAILGFPVRFFVDFFSRHGFLSIDERPIWRAVRGGSRTYADKLTAPFRQHIRLRTPVAGVKRSAEFVSVRTARGEVEHFDAVLMACHSDQALALLEDPCAQEQEILGAFPYQRNEVLLHTDTRMLPKSPRARAAWNYHVTAMPQEQVALTYDMNVLMSLKASEKFLVTLNRSADIDSSKVLRELAYSHPVYTTLGVRAQRRRGEISGVNRTFYCGAYWGAGFHEDGLASGRLAAHELSEYARSSPQRSVRRA